MENDCVTKADLKAELQETKTDLKAELQETKAELRTEMKADMAAMEQRIIDVLTEAVRDSETHLLKAFYDYGKASDIRFRKIEADHSNLDASATQRLAAIELRMVEFEKRLHELRGAA